MLSDIQRLPCWLSSRGTTCPPVQEASVRSHWVRKITKKKIAAHPKYSCLGNRTSLVNTVHGIPEGRLVWATGMHASDIQQLEGIPKSRGKIWIHCQQIKQSTARLKVTQILSTSDWLKNNYETWEINQRKEILYNHLYVESKSKIS